MTRCALAVLIVAPLWSAEFTKDISPILAKNCLPCHDDQKRSSGFSISSLDNLLKGGARLGAVIKPGNPSESILIQLLRGEAKPQMPLGRAKMPDSDIAVIERWIREAPPELTRAKSSTGYWAFVKPARPAIPPVGNSAWVRSGIDQFILAKLEAKKLKPSPEAGRRTLVRRLFFDLLGLPPTPEEAEAFVNDTSPRAYEDLVDKLLADPRYGERWGGHWLDLARYADTNGYEDDNEYPHAWRYRDYVVDAFNNDKPYDRFIREQLAGDEFYRVDSIIPAPAPEPEQAIALTFLRLAPFFRTPISEAARDSLLSEMTATTGSVFLGLTVGCAKCHDHKYDSIPTKDFYRLKAFFSAIQLGQGEAAAFARPGEKEWTDQARASRKKELEETEVAFKDFQKPLMAKLTPAPGKQATPQDLARAINIENNNMVSLEKPNDPFSAQDKAGYLGFLDKIARLKKSIARLEPLAMGIHNTEGPPNGPSLPATFVLIRGEFDHLGEVVEPGVLSAIAGNSNPAQLETDRYQLYISRGRRMTLANWIASPDNPLTARVMVNRIWQHHFGRGIVETPSDFGRNGAPPTHPELLDWLANRFVEEKWSIKAMHRLILTSSAWRQSSQGTKPEAIHIDPENQLLWRFHRQRLEGEAVRDSVLAVSGRLNPERGGLPVYPPLPPGINAKVKNADTWVASDGPESRKRSIYIFRRRSQYVPFLETFDAPVFDMPCDRRRTSVTAVQALSMYDGDFVNDEARYFAARVKEKSVDADQQIFHAFQIAFSRPPTAIEQQQARDFLRQAKGDPLTGLCRVLLNSNEFLYID